MGTVAIATCPEARDVDEDSGFLLPALAAAGVVAVEQDWSDPAVDWTAFDLVVVRSTWDYVLRRNDFVAWAERVEAGGRLANPASVIRWNTDKRYLSDLDEAGVAVVPTTFIDPPEGTEAATVARRIHAAIPHDAGFVVKPTVSAGSRDTFRHPSRDERPTTVAAAVAEVLDIHASGRTAMVQPYLDAVDRDGETGLVFFDGRFSHAFRKGPLLQADGGTVTGLFAPEEIRARTATDEQRSVAADALAVAQDRKGAPLLYARVDLLPDDDGRPVVLEVELTEPSFFLHTDPSAPARAAAAIAAAADTA